MKLGEKKFYDAKSSFFYLFTCTTEIIRIEKLLLRGIRLKKSYIPISKLKQNFQLLITNLGIKVQKKLINRFIVYVSFVL